MLYEVITNMEKLSPVYCCSRMFIRMFGGVPIRVQSPPSREPKARGISSRDGLTLARWAIS